MNYYTLLGIPEDADEATISAACAAMLKANHPDRTGTSATGHLVDVIRQARATLTDPATRAKHDKSLSPDVAPEPAPVAPVPEGDIGAITAIFQAYLADKIIDRLASQHARYVSNGPGTIAVDPKTLAFGGKAETENATWTVHPGSRPGTKVQVISGGQIVDTPSLTLSPASGGRYYADGHMWEVVFATSAQLASGGQFSIGDDDMTLVVPPGTQCVSVIDAGSWRALMVDKRIAQHLDDQDTIGITRQLLDGSS